MFVHNEASSNLTDKQCHLWALCCLMIASKYDEHDPNIPFYKEFASTSSRANFDQDTFISTEKTLLTRVLDW